MITPEPSPSTRPHDLSYPPGGTLIRKKLRLVCDRCGHEMVEHQCKLACTNCGARMDCSDLNLHFD